MPTQRSLHVEWCFWETKVLLARCHAAEGLGKITPKNSYKNYKRDKKKLSKSKNSCKASNAKDTYQKNRKKDLLHELTQKKNSCSKKLPTPSKISMIHDPCAYTRSEVLVSFS